MRNETTTLSLSEAELARLARQGHIGAFAVLFDLHKASVYALCRQTTSGILDAETLVQNIFLDVFRALASCADGVSFSELLYRAADNRMQVQERMALLSAPFLDHLVELAADPLISKKRPARFARIRALLRSERAVC